MPDERRAKWEARGIVYDDQATPDNEAPALAGGKVPWPKTPDEIDARWVPYQKGLLSIRDPFTGERHEIATKYHPGAPLLPKALHGHPVVPAPQWLVRRAMEKLPPRTPPQPQKPPPHLDDAGPL